MDSGTPQFKLKAGRVSAFQQAGAEFGMNLHARSNDGMADLLRSETSDGSGGHGYLQAQRYRIDCLEVQVIRHKDKKIINHEGHEGSQRESCLPANSFVDLRVLRGYSRFSKMPAAPMPPPTHIVTMP